MPYCIYCGAPLVGNVKDQHIIYNALCGRLVSKDICCSACNELLGETIDRQFAPQFNPILKQSYNLFRTNSSKSWPGDKYNEEFKFSSEAFQQGISKIAVEFAVYSMLKDGIQNSTIAQSLQKSIEVQHGPERLEKITFNVEVIPFYPLNFFDEFIELDAPFYLRHKLILFSEEKCLVCYVELFSTFACYVVLSTNWQGRAVYSSYVQEVKRLSSENVDCGFRSIKDLQIILMEHRLWPAGEEIPKFVCRNQKLKKKFESMDLLNFLQDREMFAELIDMADRKYYYNEIPLASAIEELITPQYSEKATFGFKPDLLRNATESILYYLDDNDCLYEGKFRKNTIEVSMDRSQVLFYPAALQTKRDSLNYEDYWKKKVDRLMAYLRESQ